MKQVYGDTKIKNTIYTTYTIYYLEYKNYLIE